MVAQRRRIEPAVAQASRAGVQIEMCRTERIDKQVAAGALQLAQGVLDRLLNRSNSIGRRF